MALIDKLSAIGDAIRAKTGKADKLTLDQMPTEIASIETGGTLSDTNKLAQRADGTLTEITAEDLVGVTDIVDYAFYGCAECTHITIPKSVIQIRSYAFARCNKLSSITFEDGINLQILGTFVFQYNYTLEHIDLPNTITDIGQRAFTYSVLKEITIPNSVHEMGNEVFAYCQKLEKVEMKSTTPPTIGTNMFKNCTALEQIIVPIGSGDAYKSATNWSAYADIIVEGEV